MLFSVIIPVYNVEKYLSECIESVLKQEFSDYEIILVDDGSKDSSGKICDEYAAKYDFINVIHKENGGLSDARNTGVKSASGDYVLFLDSDDYIGETSLVDISKHICDRNIDVVFLEATKFFPDGQMVPLGDGYKADKINGKSKKEVMEHLSQLPKFPGSACTKAIRRELILDNGIFFETGIVAEDLDWTLNLFCHAQTFAYCDTKHYFYRQGRSGSITKSSGIRGSECILYIINKWAKKESGLPYQNVINAFMAYEYMILIGAYAKLGRNDKKRIRKDIKKASWVLKFGKTKRVNMVSKMYSVAGLDLTAVALKYVRKLLK